MAGDAEDEILQDYLIEAGEILEQLNEQLVDLEQRADDTELLNTVFRGFHTIKGGAGFLNLTALVELCHVAEDVFNVLRTGQRRVDAQLMDVVLPVLDVLNAQFDSLRAGQEPEAASPSLLQQLEAMAQVEGTEATVQPRESVASAGCGAVTHESAKSNADAADAEFEAMLDASVDPATVASEASSSTDEITDDEFDALLDELHGSGKLGATPATQSVVGDADTSEESGDDISDDEFESLLDQLHGPSGAPGAASAAPSGPVPQAQAVRSAAGTAQTPQANASEARASPVIAAAPEKGDSNGVGRQTKEAGNAQRGAEATVRVDTRRLDDIMNMVGELVLVRNRLATLQASITNEDVSAAVSNLDVVTADLQMSVMKTRMQPIKKVFGRFPRVVRDLARGLNKEVSLEMHGEDTDLDKNLVEALADPLVHLVRNAVDHGIEMPDVREAAGKPRTGRIILRAEQEGDHILLTIDDDGAGMDPDVLRRKAIENGVLDEDAAARLDNHDCYNLIFAPGFSTKSEISDISGRGVGMDVVKTRIVQLNGSVEVDSEKGKGSRLRIKLPLTLAIMPTLMVRLRDQIFALPLVNVNEIFHLDLSKTNKVDGQLTVRVRDKPLPLFHLARWLVNRETRQAEPNEGFVVIISIGSQRIGFVVDHLIGQEEVVIKPLGAMLQGTPGMAGATITGDGRIALILDVPGLLKAYARRM